MNKIFSRRYRASIRSGTIKKKDTDQTVIEPNHPLMGLSQDAQDELYGLCQQFIVDHYQSPDNTPPDSYEILKALIQDRQE